MFSGLAFFIALLLPIYVNKILVWLPRTSDQPGGLGASTPVGSPGQAVQLSRENGREKRVRARGV